MLFINDIMCSNDLIKRTEKEMSIFSQYIKNPKIIFDIGANVGLYTCLMANTFKCSTVYAFEPILETYNKLLRNIEMNRLSVKTYNFGFLKEQCLKDMSLPLSKDNISGFYSVNTTNGVHPVKAEFNNLEEWCNNNSIVPDLIKLDVEGSEFEVISSSMGLIKKVKNLVVENNTKYYSENSNKTKELLGQHFHESLTMRSDSIWSNREL